MQTPEKMILRYGGYHTRRRKVMIRHLERSKSAGPGIANSEADQFAVHGRLDSVFSARFQCEDDEFVLMRGIVNGAGEVANSSNTCG